MDSPRHNDQTPDPQHNTPSQTRRPAFSQTRTERMNRRAQHALRRALKTADRGFTP